MNTPNAPIPNNLVWAILSTLFCCLPLGIVSIIHASKVDGLAAAGDLNGARAASENAKKWAIYAVVGWFVAVVLYFLFFGGMAMLGAMGGAH